MKRRTLLLSPLPFVLSSLVNAKPIAKTETAEIVIIGAGAAGLFAAVAAKENGAGRVVLIEKNPSPFFSSTSYSAGSVNASGTLAQLKYGIQDIDGKEEFTEEILRQGNYENDKALVANYVKNAAPALDWLTEKGVELTPSTNIAFRMKRMHGCDLATGARYVEVLFSEAIRLGVEIWFNAKATDLITGKGNEVLGVKYKRGRSYGNLLAQKGVILCTGGFAGDVNRVDRDIPKFAGLPTFASPSSRGEGLDMATRIGAATHLLDYMGAYAYGFPLDEETRRGLIFRGHVMNLYGSITLNKAGKRFINDDQNSTKVAQFLASRHERTVYQLATEAQLSDFMKNDQIQVIGWDRTKFNQEKEEGGHFINKVNSLEECASEMGGSFDALKNTIDAYNRSVASGNDGEFGRKFMKGQFLSGPFYLFKCTPVVGITIGGLKVNRQMQVLNEYGEPISKLFAAGEVVGGLHGTSYIGGCSLAGALALGRMVGEQLAKS